MGIMECDLFSSTTSIHNLQDSILTEVWVNNCNNRQVMKSHMLALRIATQFQCLWRANSLRIFVASQVIRIK